MNSHKLDLINEKGQSGIWNIDSDVYNKVRSRTAQKYSLTEQYCGYILPNADVLFRDIIDDLSRLRAMQENPEAIELCNQSIIRSKELLTTIVKDYRERYSSTELVPVTDFFGKTDDFDWNDSAEMNKTFSDSLARLTKQISDKEEQAKLDKCFSKNILSGTYELGDMLKVLKFRFTLTDISRVVIHPFNIETFILEFIPPEIIGESSRDLILDLIENYESAKGSQKMYCLAHGILNVILGSHDFKILIYRDSVLEECIVRVEKDVVKIMPFSMFDSNYLSAVKKTLSTIYKNLNLESLEA